jgi:hypothetical protein
MEKFKQVYFSKKYKEVIENSKGPLKVVKSNEDIVYLDSRNVFTDLRDDLFFILKKEDIINLSKGINIKTYYPEPIGKGFIIQVGDASILKVKWIENQTNKDIIKKVKNNELKDLKLFAFIVVDNEFEDTDINTLKSAYDSIKDVYFSKYGV